MSANEKDGPSIDAVQVGYGDQPSRAWLRSDNQLVLVKTLWGAVRSPYVALAREVLADAEQLEAHINAGNGDPSARQDLKLRGIWFDEMHRSLMMYVELLHVKQDKAALTEQQVCEAFYHAQTHYGRQFGMVVETITPVEASANFYDPLADSCYTEVWQAIAE